MKAFISYSHNDSQVLELLHKHLAQLKRDEVITTWTDQEIMPGGRLNDNIYSALNNTNLFIALLSPDYIASNYCYEEEFQKALQMEKQGSMLIIPVIVEPCDWHSTPFTDFKAVPKDGKAISTWDNKNTAFVDVIQNIRRLAESGIDLSSDASSFTAPTKTSLRNYKSEKDFDSIQKLEFADKTFHEIKELLKRYLKEILSLEGIKHMITTDVKETFECILVNRNKINTESHLTLTTIVEKSGFNIFSNEKQINYSLSIDNRPTNKSFSLAFDKYHLYWTENSYMYSSNDQKEFGAKEIAEVIWEEWLQSVGIG